MQQILINFLFTFFFVACGEGNRSAKTFSKPQAVACLNVACYKLNVEHVTTPTSFNAPRSVVLNFLEFTFHFLLHRSRLSLRKLFLCVSNSRCRLPKLHA
jgi:hypothetical protein